MPKWEHRPRWNRKWNVPAGALAVLLLVNVSAVAIARGRDGSDRVAQTSVSAERVTDSAAGGVDAPATAPRVDPSGLPADFVSSVRRAREAGVPADFVAGVRARSESGTSERGTFSRGEDGMVVYTPPARRAQQPTVPAPQPRPTQQPVRRDTPSTARTQPIRPGDTTFGLPAPFIPPPPVVPQRDTVRPDTLRPPPDTLRVRGVSLP